MATAASKILGTVSAVIGKVLVRHPDGVTRELKVGDVIREGDVILAGADARIEIKDEAGALRVPRIGESLTALALDPVDASDARPREQAEAAELDRVISEVDAGQNPDATPAAGLDGGADGGLAPGLRVDRVVENVSGSGGTVPTGTAGGTTDPAAGARADDAAPVVASSAITASEEGPDVNLGLTLPQDDNTGVQNLVVTVTGLPVIGHVAKADGTRVTLATPLTAEDLPGLVYVPPQDYDGSPVGGFTYTVSDGTQVASGGTTIVVTPVNDAPAGPPVAVSTPEDTPVAGQVAATDVDGDVPTFRIDPARLPAHGSVTVAPDGRFTYTPSPDYHGADAFHVIADDGQGGQVSIPVTVTVTPVNDAPKAEDVSVTTPEDVPVQGTLTGNDVDGDPLTFTLDPTRAPSHGTVVLQPGGTYVYTPAENYHGPDSFDVIVDDGQGGTTTLTVDVTVTPVNDAPAGPPVNVTTPEDTPVGGNVTAIDVDGDPVTFTLDPGRVPSHGTVTVQPDGSFIYTPGQDYNGTDQFHVIADDGQGGKTPILVTVNVTPVNDVPVGPDEFISTPEDTPVTSAVQATDVDGDSLTYTLDPTRPPSHGSVTVRPDGTYTYVPGPDYVGTDVFDVTVNDGHGGTTTITVNVVVTPVNDAPAGPPVALTTPEDTAISSSVTATDPEGDPLTFTVLQPPAHGTVTLLPNGSFTYVPAPDYNGPDSFNVLVNDGHGGTSVIPVNITVTPVNDLPTARPDAQTINENTVATGNVLSNDSDPDGDPLSVVSFTVNGTTHAAGTTVILTSGALSIGTSGNYTFTPNPGWVGQLPTVTYTLTDGTASTSSTLDIQVVAVNDPPVAVIDRASLSEGKIHTVYGNVLTNDWDPEGDPLTVSGFTVNGIVYAANQSAALPSGGTLFIAGNGSYTFTPPPDWSGTFPTVKYTITDGKGSASAALVITLDPSVPMPQQVTQVSPDTVVEGTALVYNVTLSGPSPTATTHSFSLGGGSASAADYGTPSFSNGVTYDAGSGTISIPAGVTSFEITLPTVDDATIELSETVPLNVGGVAATGTILDNDFPPPTVDVPDLNAGAAGQNTVSEASGTPPATGTFTVTAEAGLASITVHGETIGLAALQNLSSAPITVETDRGFLTLTGFDDASGAVSYSYTVNGPQNHPADNYMVDGIPLTVTDNQGASAPGSLDIQILDTVPTAGPVDINVSLDAGNTNIMLMLDSSGSMAFSSGIPGQTRMQVMRAAVNQLLDTYGELGNVRVLLVDFDHEAGMLGGGWVTLSTAKALVDSLDTAGATNYDAALRVAMQSFESAGRFTGPNTQNVAYFLSDGEPTWSDLNDPTNDPNTYDPGKGDGINATEQSAWEAFLTTHNINSYAIGLGASGPSAAQLNPIAYNPASPATSDSTNTIVVTDLSQLSATIQATVNAPPVSGDLTSEGGINIGADVDGGYLRSITLGGVTYTHDVDTNSIVTSGGTPATFSFDPVTHTLTVATPLGGTFSIDMRDADIGRYNYQAPNQAGTEQIGYTLVDADGDTASSTINVQVSAPPTVAPDAQADSILTNVMASQITVPSGLLLANDQPTGNALNLSGTTFNTGWVARGADFTRTSLRTIDFDATSNESANRNLTISRSDFTRAGQASGIAAVAVDGYLGALSGGSASNREDSIRVLLKAGETLTLDHDLPASWVSMAITPPGGSEVAVSDGGSFTAATSGTYTIRIANIDDNGGAFGGTGAEDYLLNLRINYSGTAIADATGSYTVEDNRGNTDSAAVTLSYQEGSTLTGTSGNESLMGSGNADTLIGGKGSDVMYGGAGADVFKWQLNDGGSAGTPAHDTILDFDNSNGGDVLDLRDLLVGESAGSLSNYLHIESSGGNTVVQVSSTGGFTSGNFNAAAVDQTITLAGVDLMGGQASEQVIQDLLSRGKLIIGD